MQLAAASENLSTQIVAHFQFNSKINSQLIDKKSELGRYNGNYYWLENKTSDILSVRKKGWAIKQSRDNFGTFIVIDHDAEDGLTIDKICKHELVKNHAWFVESSYSGLPHKWHIFFKVDRPFAESELLDSIKRWGIENFSATNESFAPQQIWYAPRSSDHIRLISETNRISIDKIVLDYPPALTSDQNSFAIAEDLPLAASTGGVTRNVEAFLYERLWKRFNGDFKTLCTSHFEGCGVQINKLEADDEFLRFSTFNVFEDKEYSEQGGSSMHVICRNGRLPTFIDRSLTFVNQDKINHATFFDYIFVWRMKTDPVFVAQFRDSKKPDGSFKQGYFIKFVNYICRLFQIQEYTFNVNSAEIINGVLKNLSASTFILKGSWSKNVCKMVFFDVNQFVYDRMDNQSFATIVLAREVLKVRPDIVDVINTEIDYQNSIRKEGERKKSFISDFGKYLLKFVVGHEFDQLFQKIDSLNSESNLIAIDDFVFNVFDKSFEKNHGQCKSFQKPYKGLNLDVQSDDPDIQMFLKYFHGWCGNKALGDCLLAWYILNLQRQAHTLRHCVALIAPTKAGKSAYFNFLISTLNQENQVSVATDITPAQFFTDYNHAGYLLADKHFVFVDEVNNIGFGQFVEKIKYYTQGRERNIVINPKGEHQYSQTAKFAISVVFEEKMTVVTDAGTDGRLVMAIVKNPTKNKAAFDRMSDRAVQDKILGWALMQPIDHWKKVFFDSIRDDYFISTRIEKKRETDPLYQFILDCVEFTGDSKDRLSSKDLYDAFGSWNYLENGSMKNPFQSSNSFIRHFRPLINDEDLIPYAKGNGEWFPKNIGGNNIYCCIRLKPVTF